MDAKHKPPKLRGGEESPVANRSGSQGDGRASTRDLLIDAAYAVVARDGLEAASVKTIAREAGVTPGLLHYHFETKERLLEAALRRALDDYLVRSRARRLSTPPQRQMPEFFAAARAAIGPDRDFFKFRLALAARAMHDPALAAIMRDVNAAAVDETARVFAAAEGLDAPGERHSRLASMLKASFDGVMLAWIADPEFPIEDAGALFETLTAAILRP